MDSGESATPRLAPKSLRAVYLPWLKVSVALRYALTFPWTPEAQLNVAPAAGMRYVGQQACQSAPQ
jgi:hypothetical protein